MGDATLDIDGTRSATMNGAQGKRAYAETQTLNWAEGQEHTLRITFRGIHPFEILNDGSVLLQWKTPARAYSPAIENAVNAAQKSDVAIVYATTIEGEAHDRVSLKLPQSADQLIEAVSAVNPHTIVVLANAGPVTMPWLDRVDAVVETYYGGQAQGAALARVLWGDVNPSGKLTMTYPTSEEALPPGIESPYAGADDLDVVYGEGIKVGYKGYEAAGITPLFPFGFGLSYSKFKYSDLTVSGTNPAQSPIGVRFKITNTGKRDGDEVAQVYVRLPSSTGEQKRLVGYSRVSTQAGKSTTVDVTIDPTAPTHPLGYFDTGSDSWKIASGTYRVFVGKSSRSTPLRATFTVG
jgi:beta-glucosidase